MGIYKYTKLTQQTEGGVEFILNFDPDYSTACIEKIACSMESKKIGLDWALYEQDTSFFDARLAELGEDALFEQNVTWTYETSLEYQCPRAKAFTDGSLAQTFTCQWDG